MEDIKKKERNGEPLEWELQLINKDHDTRKMIFDILTQKNDIEAYAKATERPEDYLKDIKDLAHNSYNLMNQYPESEREKERARRKQANKRRMEKQYIDDIKKWERHEEDKDRERLKSKANEEELSKRKKRLIEKDLNYDSDEEKRRLKDVKRVEENKSMRQKENEFDEMMRRRDNPHLYQHEHVNNTVTDLVAVEVNNEIQTDKQAEDKVFITFREYEDDEEDTTKQSIPKVTINLEKKPAAVKTHTIAEEDDQDDPFTNKTTQIIEIDEETEKGIQQISEEVRQSRQVEEKRKLQQQNIKNIVNKSNTNESSQKLIELQKEIFQAIPKERDELFRYPVNWNYLIKVSIKFNI
jgi:hypothetical protein